MVGLLSSGGRFLFGTLSDHAGREKIVTVSFICSISGILILLFLPALKSVFFGYTFMQSFLE
jgi:nitrate/nitrite transporter NarK